MSKRGIKLYIEDVRDSIAKIEKYTMGLDFNTFVKDEKTIDAVVRNLSIIGEAVKNFPDELKSKYPQVPWKCMPYFPVGGLNARHPSPQAKAAFFQGRKLI